MKKYDLNDKAKELKRDIDTFEELLKNTNDKIQIIMYKNLINENKKELDYIYDYIKKNGPSIDNYKY